MIDSYYLDRGRKRLANWAEWASRDSPALGYPTASPYARLAKACDGWDSSDEHYATMQSEAPVDDLDAERVEALIMMMPAWLRRLVCDIYLRNATPAVLIGRLRITRAVFDARLLVVEEAVGRGSLTALALGDNSAGGGLPARK